MPSCFSALSSAWSRFDLSDQYPWGAHRRNREESQAWLGKASLSADSRDLCISKSPLPPRRVTSALVMAYQSSGWKLKNQMRINQNYGLWSGDLLNIQFVGQANKKISSIEYVVPKSLMSSCWLYEFWWMPRVVRIDCPQDLFQRMILAKESPTTSRKNILPHHGVPIWELFTN